MSTHLVIGSSGLVGCHLVAEAGLIGQSVVSADLQPLGDARHVDISRPGDAAGLIRAVAPTIVSLPAGMSHVDGCESDPATSWAINVAPLVDIVHACNEVGAHLVFFSSDYVFDGADGPYAEDDPVRPISVYGQHKVAAEHVIATQARSWLIVRTTVVYGTEPAGKNFVARLVSQLSDGREVMVPADQIGTPTSARGLAVAAVALAERGHVGVVNVAGPDLMDRYEFARLAAQAFGLPTSLLAPVTTESLGQIAPRPLRAGLISARVAQLGLSHALIPPQQGLDELAGTLTASGDPGS